MKSPVATTPGAELLDEGRSEHGGVWFETRSAERFGARPDGHVLPRQAEVLGGPVEKATPRSSKFPRDVSMSSGRWLRALKPVEIESPIAPTYSTSARRTSATCVGRVVRSGGPRAQELI